MPEQCGVRVIARDWLGGDFDPEAFSVGEVNRRLAPLQPSQTLKKFDWDPQKAASNLAKHGVLFEDAATVFGDLLGRIETDPRQPEGEERFLLLGLSRGQRAVSGESMKKERRKGRGAGGVDLDEILPEYDFSSSRPNKYASRYAAGSIVVVLEPDVAAAFPSAEEANEALRALAGIIQKHRPRPTASRRA